jgi:competence protein ComEC
MRRWLLPLLLLSMLPIAAVTATWRQPSATVIPVSETVYVTKTQEKYHRGICRYLSQSKRAIELDMAKASGYTPCSRCKPPR